MRSSSEHKPATNGHEPIGEGLSASSFFPMQVGVTAGKSDVIEAVIQWMLLKELCTGSATPKPLLISIVKKRAEGAISLTDDAIHTALAKLEISGWVSESRQGLYGSSVYKLSQSAKRYLPQEAAQWKFFAAHARKIVDLLD